MFGEIVRNVFARESLGLDPESSPRRAARRDALRAAAARDVLPLDPEPAPHARGPGLLALLFAPERLPQEAVEAPRRSRHRWLAWLFRPEPLDPP